MMQPGRVAEVKERCAQMAREHGIDPDFARQLYGLIIDEACRMEDEIIDDPGPCAGESGQVSTGPFRQIVIAGGGGAVGTLFADALRAAGCPAVAIIDRRPTPATSGQASRFLAGRRATARPRRRSHWFVRATC